jgi:hypothetical protein
VASPRNRHGIATASPRHRHGIARCLMLVLLLALLFGGGVAGQAPGELGNRRSFILHVYVDPIHGDDDWAKDVTGTSLQFAPNPAATFPNPVLLSTHPSYDNQPTSNWTGRIVQLPYPFRTVNAALDYLDDNRVGVIKPLLPSQIPTVNYKFSVQLPEPEDYYINRVVIHCLPGLYGTSVAIDQRSGLRFNGESQFPIILPDGVSIQGTSALDTIFDGRHEVCYIFQVGPGPVTGTWAQHSFIDGVTIRGARSGSQSAPPDGCGVVIYAEGELKPVISNCFITDNEVGIAVDAYAPLKYDSGEPGQVSEPLPWKWVHSPIIVNNTIAWNHFGIWSGQLILNAPWSQEYGCWNAGWSRPRILNNIIDSGDPNGYWPQGTSCFEGLHPEDLTVQAAVHTVNGTVNIGLDFNAYELGRHNLCSDATNPIPCPPGWFAVGGPVHNNRYITRPRGGTSGSILQAPPLNSSQYPTYAPRTDLLPYTQTGTGQARRALYVNETLAYIHGVPFSNIIDSCSPHDFRLTVHPTNGDPSDLNPLTDLGIHLSAGAYTQLRMANWAVAKPGLAPTIDYEPGLKTAGAENAGYDADCAWFHAWDFDCEGYGNLRVVDRPDIPNQPGYGAPFSYIDLGADEMGDLIMAGFIDKTRIFSVSVPGTGGSNPPANAYVYFINRWRAAPNNPSYPRPQFTQWTGRDYSNPSSGVTDWWSHVQQLPPVVMPNPAVLPNLSTGHFIYGATASPRFSHTNPLGTAYEAFPRSLECDWTPALLPDIHPAWGVYLGDVFAYNPWIHHGYGPYPLDNRLLYYYPPDGYCVVSGHINPPGTTMLSSNGFLWGATMQFGPYSGGGTPAYTVGTAGVGDALSLDVAPSTSGGGVRYNCQALPVGGSSGFNCQSFLVVMPSSAPATAFRGNASYKTPQVPTAALPPIPTASEVKAETARIRAEVRRILAEGQK